MKVLLGLFIWPWTLALGYALGRALQEWYFFDRHQLLLFMGFLGDLVVHVVLYRPVIAYVMAHEFTHAFWAWLLGRRVQEVRVGRESGHVVMASEGRSNVSVALIPYIFPLYTMMLIGLTFIVIPVVMPYLMCLIGASLGFHVCLTLYALRTSQSDLAATGRFLGVSVIAFANLVVIIGLLSLLAPDTVKIPKVAADTVDTLRSGVTWIIERIQRRDILRKPTV